jgi:hypothetical protein
MAQTQAQGRIATQGRKLAQHLAGGRKEHGMASQERLMGDVARKRCLTHCIGADQDNVVRALDEVESQP